MYKSVVYEGDKLLGEVEVYPQNQNQNQDQNGVVFDKEIRISHFSQPSERCPPLAVLHTITSNGVCFKMESKSHSQDSPLYLLHSSCSEENKTAVMLLGGEELHLVAMASRKNDGRCLCFWGFNIALGLYKSCLVMLNLRCLGIVFDLDETLIVANTMRSSILQDALPPKELNPAEKHCKVADAVLCLGTSLQITPSCNLPLKSLRGGGKFVIASLQ